MAVGAVVAGVCIVGGILLGLHLALRQTPDFYQAAVAIPMAQQEVAGQQFERNVLGLHNDIQQSGEWKRIFTAAQINGWLAVDLPDKFPQSLPTTIHDPRVELAPGRLQVAFRYEGEKLSTIISLSLEVQLADEPNTLSVRIRQAHAGWVPIPLKDFLDQLSDAARQADLMLRWAHRGGDPVALITIPRGEDKDAQDSFLLKSIEIRSGELVLSGLTGQPAEEDTPKSTATPQSPARNGQSGVK